MTQHQNEVLDRSSLFRFLPEERADCLRAVLQEERFEFGDVIVREGDEADACYILVTGRARVVKEIREGSGDCVSCASTGRPVRRTGAARRRSAKCHRPMQYCGWRLSG